ncbi:uncharacterized protein TNCV_3285421 [Trichonephila clavipes]|nr:uncharacterized protein TNCV_3285421 [Trichonephila clavipes]
MKRKENFQWLPKELHQLKYEAISVPQGSVRLVKKTQERKSSTCYLLITKGVTSLSPVPLKTRHERESSIGNGKWIKFNLQDLITDRQTDNGTEMDITLRKRSKIIALNEHSSMTVRDIATVFGVEKSSVSRIFEPFQDSLSSSGKRKGKQTENYSKN